MKYPDEQNVMAQYSESPLSGQFLNPYLEAMPQMLSRQDFFDRLKCFPSMPDNLSMMNGEQRRQELSSLLSVFYPMDYMYVIYDMLYRAMTVTYTTKSTIDSVRQINAVHQDFRTGEASRTAFATEVESGSILGVPGIGKTSSIRRCLNLMPQVITHMEYNGKPFYSKQITYLVVECPSDCSVKTLAFHIAAAIDRAIGSEYFERISSIRSSSASAIATQIKIICLNHHIGVIVIDEIQNAVTTAQKSNQVKPLIRFLVELTNDTCASIFFIGTPVAEELFVSQEHLKRRTRGLRLLPFKPDTVYRDFLSVLWAYQYTAQKTPLTEKIANKIYDYSAGIPAYIMKIVLEAQTQAILSGQEILNEHGIQETINRLALQPPKTFLDGTSISDFSLKKPLPVSLPATEPEQEEETQEQELQQVPRLYAKTRGRKPKQRDRTDLLEFLKQTRSTDAMVSVLEKFGLTEGVL